MCYKICYFQKEASNDIRFFNKDNLLKMGFSVESVCGVCQKAFEYFSKNRVDILILDTTNIEKERLSLAVDIIYNNYCKNIILITNQCLKPRDGLYLLSADDMHNIDLKIDTILLDIRRKDEDRCSKNIPLIKTKICDYLINLKFNSRLDGFKYYIDAVCKMFLRFPERYSMMDIYQEVGETYGKSAYAVEKSMRGALLSAIKKLNSLPEGKENDKVRGMLAYDMNNRSTTNMLVNKLMLDDEIKESMDQDFALHAINV